MLNYDLKYNVFSVAGVCFPMLLQYSIAKSATQAFRKGQVDTESFDILSRL
jgi:hypothetical protein